MIDPSIDHPVGWYMGSGGAQCKSAVASAVTSKMMGSAVTVLPDATWRELLGRDAAMSRVACVQEVAMGLSDVLNGMKNGPRGGGTTSTTSPAGGMSPITMGLLALLAYKALKGSGILGNSPTEQPRTAPGSTSTALSSIARSAIPAILGQYRGPGRVDIFDDRLGFRASKNASLDRNRRSEGLFDRHR